MCCICVYASMGMERRRASCNTFLSGWMSTEAFFVKDSGHGLFALKRSIWRYISIRAGCWDSDTVLRGEGNGAETTYVHVWIFIIWIYL